MVGKSVSRRTLENPSTAVLLGIHEVEKCLDVIATVEAGFNLGFLESGGDGILPSALGQKGVPNFDLLGVGPGAVAKAPFQNLHIAPAL